MIPHGPECSVRGLPTWQAAAAAKAAEAAARAKTAAAEATAAEAAAKAGEAATTGEASEAATAAAAAAASFAHLNLLTIPVFSGAPAAGPGSPGPRTLCLARLLSCKLLDCAVQCV